MIAALMMDSDRSSAVTSSSVSNASSSPAASLDALYDYFNVLTNGMNAQFGGSLPLLYQNPPQLVSQKPAAEPTEENANGKGKLFMEFYVCFF